MASKNARSASVRTPTKLKRKGHPQTNPNSLANLKPPWRAGDPSPNPSGKPKLLGEAYKKYLALPPNPKFVALLSDWGDVPKTNAELIAARAILDAASGNDGARREIRAATEGEKLRTWEDDLADLVREGTATVDDVRAEFGNEIAARIFVRLGVLPSQSRSVQSETTRAE